MFSSFDSSLNGLNNLLGSLSLLALLDEPKAHRDATDTGPVSVAGRILVGARLYNGTINQRCDARPISMAGKRREYF
jgi:hypothetical protein